MIRKQALQNLDTRHWAYSAVTGLQAQGTFVDYPAGYFRGRRILTRLEFAVAVEHLLQRSAGMNAYDKAVLDGLAQEFSTELELLKENRLKEQKPARHAP